MHMPINTLRWTPALASVLFQVYTLPEYLKKRFGGQRLRVYLSIFAIVLYIITKLAVSLFINALWSPAGKELNSWLSLVMSNCEVVTIELISWVRCGA